MERDLYTLLPAPRLRPDPVMLRGRPSLAKHDQKLWTLLLLGPQMDSRLVHLSTYTMKWLDGEEEEAYKKKRRRRNKEPLAAAFYMVVYKSDDEIEIMIA